VQLNKRVGKRFFFGSNFTWSKTIVYSRDQFVSDQLLKNVASGTGLSASAPVSGGSRPFAFNLNFGYTVPNGSSLWRNKFTEFVADNWHLEGIVTLYSGVPLTISCSAARRDATPACARYFCSRILFAPIMECCRDTSPQRLDEKR
jgi:hypothetical protein